MDVVTRYAVTIVDVDVGVPRRSTRHEYLMSFLHDMNLIGYLLFIGSGITQENNGQACFYHFRLMILSWIERYIEDTGNHSPPTVV